jgi:hypothetical protein
MALTKDEFMAALLAGYEAHLVAVLEGREEPYSYLKAEGVDYGDYLEHRHGWPVIEDGLCGPSSVADGCCDEHNQVYEVEFDECPTCLALIRMYEAKEAPSEQ